MATSLDHSRSSVKKFGGEINDFIGIHSWFDESKSHYADFRHRALRHHSEGIFMMERFFGEYITLSSGKLVATRLIGEQHVIEDCGFIPSVKDWLSQIQPTEWMRKVGKGREYFTKLEEALKEPKT